jgi:Holliday junction DNA helicase RuvA
MIGWLHGTVRELDAAGSVLLETHGVGYDVTISLQTLCALKCGDLASLYIHTYVREDQLQLFGFLDADERALFRRLNGVSGIGARMALNLMSGMPMLDLVAAIEQADDAAIARTPGIGKKTAQRLILELQGKLVVHGTHEAGGAPVVSRQDVHSALVNLGYRAAVVDKALRSIDPKLDFEQAFKQALKALA